MRGLRFYAAMRRAEKRRAVNTEKRGLEAMMKEDFFLQETCEIMSGLFNARRPAKPIKFYAFEERA